MNVTQIHDRLRLELQRRIQRGTLSVSLLARQTGLGQPHLSNFLHGHRRLSLAAMDRILSAQRLSAADLLPAMAYGEAGLNLSENEVVPLVSHRAALFEPYIRQSAIQSVLHLPVAALEALHARPSASRRSWQRFVAVRIPADDARSMQPVVLPDAIALIDRHYNQLAPYRAERANLYAVRHDQHLKLRYVERELHHLVLRTLSVDVPVELIDLNQWNVSDDLLAGRVAFLLNEL